MRSRGDKKNAVVLYKNLSQQDGMWLHVVAPTCANMSTFVNTKASEGVTVTACTKVIPDAGTFFDEFFHLVIGSSQKTPANGEECLASRTLGEVACASGTFVTLI